MRIDLERNENNEIVFEGKDGRVILIQEKNSLDTTVYLYSGAAPRKIVIKNVTNVSEALRDSLECMQPFVMSSETLKAILGSFRKNIWPTLDGKELVPTFENVDVHKLDLSSRSLNALEKNDIGVLGQIPDTLDEIRKLRSVGANAAKEILSEKDKYLKVLGTKRKKKSSKKKSPNKVKKVVSKNKRQLIVESNLPKNLQKILMANTLAFVDEIPKDIEQLLKLKKLGPSKARQILNLVG